MRIVRNFSAKIIIRDLIFESCCVFNTKFRFFSAGISRFGISGIATVKFPPGTDGTFGAFAV